MTICIAALCDHGSKIVAVADTKITFDGEYSADDVLLKMVRIAPDWVALVAGESVTDIEPIVGGARAILRAAQLPLTAEVVSNALHQAHRARLRAQIEAQVLERYNYTLETFLQDGRDQLTEKVFDDLVDKISKVTLSLQFIVAGFEETGRGHLFQVDGDHAPADHSQHGYSVVGSGSRSAYSALSYHAERGGVGEHAGLCQTVYCCCDAKFMAESASDVGRHTFLAVLEHGKKDQNILGPRIDIEIRKEWERYGAPRIPKSVTARIPDMLFSVEDLGKEDVFKRAVGKLSKKTSAGVVQEYKALHRALQARMDKIDTETEEP